jgi:hypothetical protein
LGIEIRLAKRSAGIEISDNSDVVDLLFSAICIERLTGVPQAMIRQTSSPRSPKTKSVWSYEPAARITPPEGIVPRLVNRLCTSLTLLRLKWGYAESAAFHGVAHGRRVWQTIFIN